MPGYGKSVTLIELMLVIVIIGILAAVAIPRFTKTFEVTRAKQALAALQQIRTAERIYRTKEEFYYPHSTDHPAAVADPDEILQVLKIVLDKSAERNWDFSIDTDPLNLNNFTATATRRGGIYNTETIIINETGIDPSSTWPLPIPEE